jgi:hypothetical protein
MSWLSQNHRILQLGLLILLLASFFAPWNYEADGVPPPEYCDPPYVLLTPERCVKLVSGAEMFGYTAFFFQELVRSALSNQPVAISELWRVIFLILLISLPVLPLPVLTWRVLASFQSSEAAEQARPLGRIVLYGSLALGWLAALGLFLLNWPPQPWLFWGLWLYLIFNDAALMLEILAQAGMRSAPQTA